jgi:predicted transcriptional regulator
MKTAVYSWRLSDELKSSLEREARLRKLPVSAILEDATRDWLRRASSSPESEEKEQQRLHEAAKRCFGVIETKYPGSSERVREIVRERVRKRLGR